MFAIECGQSANRLTQIAIAACFRNCLSKIGREGPSSGLARTQHRGRGMFGRQKRERTSLEFCVNKRFVGFRPLGFSPAF